MFTPTDFEKCGICFQMFCLLEQLGIAYNSSNSVYTLISAKSKSTGMSHIVSNTFVRPLSRIFIPAYLLLKHAETLQPCGFDLNAQRIPATQTWSQNSNRFTIHNLNLSPFLLISLHSLDIVCVFNS